MSSARDAAIRCANTVTKNEKRRRFWRYARLVIGTGGLIAILIGWTAVPYFALIGVLLASSEEAFYHGWLKGRDHRDAELLIDHLAFQEERR